MRNGKRPSRYSQVDLDAIFELMNKIPFSGHLETDSTGKVCKVKILGRGEMAFYQREGDALLIDIMAGYGYINAKSIRWWHNGKKISKEEKSDIVAVMTKVMKRLGAVDVKVSY